MAPPTEIQIIVKTHKLSILIQVPHNSTLAPLKSSVLSALEQFAESDSPDLADIPKVSHEGEFELVKSEGAGNVRYVEVDGKKTMKEQRIATWTTLFIRFRDDSGNLQDVVVQEPSIDDE